MLSHVPTQRVKIKFNASCNLQRQASNVEKNEQSHVHKSVQHTKNDSLSSSIVRTCQRSESFLPSCNSCNVITHLYTSISHLHDWTSDSKERPMRNGCVWINFYKSTFKTKICLVYSEQAMVWFNRKATFCHFCSSHGLRLKIMLK